MSPPRYRLRVMTVKGLPGGLPVAAAEPEGEAEAAVTGAIMAAATTASTVVARRRAGRSGRMDIVGLPGVHGQPHACCRARTAPLDNGVVEILLDAVDNHAWV